MRPYTKKIFQKIYDLAVEASETFELILSLFGTSENIKLINRTTPRVFSHFHNALLDGVILKLTKLTEPAKSKGSKNLSINYLIKLLENEESPIISQLKNPKQKIDSFLTELRNIRNKRIAHNNLTTHQKDLHKIINNEDINNALEELNEFFNIISMHYMNGASSQLKPIYPLGDGPDWLMSYLRVGADVHPVTRKLCSKLDR